jgi:hypothetical protein
MWLDHVSTKSEREAVFEVAKAYEGNLNEPCSRVVSQEPIHARPVIIEELMDLDSPERPITQTAKLKGAEKKEKSIVNNARSLSEC